MERVIIVAVKKKEIEKDMSSNFILQYLRDFNKFLEGVPTTIANFFDRVFKAEAGLTQKAVDMICEWAAWKVNIMVEAKRQEFVKALHEQNSWVDKILTPIRVVKKISEDPLGALEDVATAIKEIANIFIGPFVFLVNFLQELIKELARLANNLANLLTSLPPPPPSSNISFDKFQLKIGQMGMSTILDDPTSLPPPEEMFPEPIVPFSVEYFKALGNEAKTIYREEKPFYELKD